MQQVTLPGDGRTWVRIPKHKARAVWGKLTVVLVPHKLVPFGPWASSVKVFPEEAGARPFETYVRDFEWYNCCYEVGYYTAFYVEKIY